MKRANLHLSAEHLAALLGLREGVVIVDASFNRKRNAVELHLHGDGLPEITKAMEGAEPQWISLDAVTNAKAEA